MSQLSKYPTLNQPIDALVGDNGVIVPPKLDTTFWVVDIDGTAGHITTTGDVISHSITIDLAGGIADNYPTDNGIAEPINYTLNVIGGSNINTAAPPIPGNTIVINLNDNVHITGYFIADGDITSSAGNIAATLGEVNAGTSMDAGTTITAGTGITSTTGNIVATAGEVNAGTSMTAQTNITATTGDITATAGDIVATAGNIIATAGEVNAGTSMDAGTTITAGTGITATTGNITATLGNVVITAGSLNLPNTSDNEAEGEITLGGNRWISNNGTQNTFVGETSGNAGVAVTATNCTGIGYFSLANITTGNFNSGLGSKALANVTTGDVNLALGYEAGYSYTTESSNICLGSSGTVGDAHIIRIGNDGSGAGQQTDCYIAGNTHITRNLLLPNTTAADATGEIQFGGGRFISNYGTLNTFVGYLSGNTSLTIATATGNTGIGSFSLSALTSGTRNCCIGYSSGYVINSGSNNISTGVASLQTLTTGTFNSVYGDGALAELVSGSYNICLGYSSGNTTGVGTGYEGAESSNILLGSMAGVTGESHVMRLGAPGSANGQQNKCFIAGVTGVTPAAVAQLTITDTSGQMGTLGAAIDGQIPIGSTGANPVLSTLTAGANITITNAAGSITIASTGGGGGIPWTPIFASQALASNNGYLCDSISLLLLSLPTVSAIGDIIRVTGISTGNWRITQGAGQQISYGVANTTLGATGYVQSTFATDTIEIVCTVANLNWQTLSSFGNITVN